VLYTTSERPKDPKVPVHDALWVVDADGKNRRKVFSEPNVGALGAWSPDGRHLVVIRWDWSRDERGKGIDGKTYRAELLPVEGGASKVLARFPWMARLGMPDWR
jgi:Tol biopolymer transport system component